VPSFSTLPNNNSSSSGISHFNNFVSVLSVTHQSEDRTRTLWTAKYFLWPWGFLRSVCSKKPRTVWDERCRYPAHDRDRRGDSWEGRGVLEASHSTGSPMAARKTFIHPKWKHAIQPPGSCGCFSPTLHRDAPVCFPSTRTLKLQYERVGKAAPVSLFSIPAR